MVDGLHSIIVTDRDGVPLLKVADEHAPELAMRSRFLSTYGMTSEQASKLGLGLNKSIVTVYGNYQVVCLTKPPLLVTLVANSNANTGMILSLEKEMEDCLQVLRTVVDVS